MKSRKWIELQVVIALFENIWRYHRLLKGRLAIYRVLLFDFLLFACLYRRVIFNWVHRSVGLIALLLAGEVKCCVFKVILSFKNWGF